MQAYPYNSLKILILKDHQNSTPEFLESLCRHYPYNQTTMLLLLVQQADRLAE